jgi:uncharacterized membrane protein
MDQTKAADEPLFKALLTPHRSLGRTGFYILMGVFVMAWLTLGSASWPWGPGRSSASSASTCC